MPDQPFAITAKDFTELLQQTQLLFDELYSERIAGAEVGDVMAIGDDDILALTLSTDPGLEKTSNSLRVKVKTSGGITRDSSGLSLTIDWSDATSAFKTTGQGTVGHLKLLERSTDPTAPSEGEAVIWMSNGLEKGDDGDVLIASTAGGVTKYATLFDYSAGGAW
uniref:Avian adenovirus fibre N-terminal domain-containing protein n=1 Tax=viral metagenome TaxID=1070528 RepID=A0A6M3J0N1_9ZZZZ